MPSINRIVLLPILLLAGCATTEYSSGPTLPPDMSRAAGKSAPATWANLDEREQRLKIAQLLPASVKDKSGWAADLQTAYASLNITPAAPTFCASIAVIEQESTFQVDPSVPGLPDIVQHDLERRAGKFGIPKLLVEAALLKSSPDGRSYRKRIDALKTELQLNALFEDMIAELPFGKDWLADYNPIHTAGPMQVSIKFAEQQASEKGYPYPVVKTVRDEVFTRRGGVFFGSAILMDYPVTYDEVVYRFADFNAGRYASRNAAFQAALARLSGKSLDLDGDLLRYSDGKPADSASEVETALRQLAGKLQMIPLEIRRDLLLEKSAGFGSSPLYGRVFNLAEQSTGQKLARQAMPQINLKSPKISRKLSTEWFAQRVETRYRACLQRGEKAAGSSG